MPNPYSRPSLTGYNQNAPPDDGSELEANRVQWAKHKNKLGDPLRTFMEAVDQNTFAAFAKRFGNAVRTDNTDATLNEGDDGKLVSVTGSTTITLPGASAVGVNWVVIVLNSNSSETVTVTGNGSQTINGSASVSVFPGKFGIFISNGSNFLALEGQPPGSVTTSVLADNALSADDEGRGKMAPNYFSADDDGREKFADDFFGDPENGSGVDPLLKFETDFFSADSDGRRPFEDGFVNQSMLKTTSGSVSLSVVATDTTYYSLRELPGGEYGFNPETRLNWGLDSSGDAAGSAMFGHGSIIEHQQNPPTSEDPVQFAPYTDNASDHDSGYVQQVFLYSANSDTTGTGISTMRVRQRYVQSSPPYDLGNGDIPLFLFVHVRADGSIGGTYIAEDPPWANNGPTRISADVYDPKTRKLYQRRPCPEITKDDVLRGDATMAALAQAYKSCKTELVEITKDFKNADMHLHPHSWVHTPTDGRIVLLDPCSSMIETLRDMNNAGEDIDDLLVEGHILIDNESCGANCPPETMAVGFKWRDTRKKLGNQS